MLATVNVMIPLPTVRQFYVTIQRCYTSVVKLMYKNVSLTSCQPAFGFNKVLPLVLSSRLLTLFIEKSINNYTKHFLCTLYILPLSTKKVWVFQEVKLERK